MQSHPAKRRRLNAQNENCVKIEKNQMKSAPHSIVPNPFGVLPLGNKFMIDAEKAKDVRNLESLGNFFIMEDEIILAILGYVQNVPIPVYTRAKYVSETKNLIITL